jgi:DNA repair exonuclease SbcCD ATPase subunit
MEVMTKLYNTNEGTVNLQRGNNTIILTEDKAIKGASAVNAKLPQLLGMNTELLAALTYRPQKTPGLFLSKTNSEMQDFLTTLLDLGKYEKAIEASQEQVKVLQTKHVQYGETLVGKQVAYTALQLDAPSYGKAPESIKPFTKQADEAITFVEEHQEIVARLSAEAASFKQAWAREVDTLNELSNNEVKQLSALKPIDAPTSNEKIANLMVLIAKAQARLDNLQAEESNRKAIWEVAVVDTQNHINRCDYAIKSLPAYQLRQQQILNDITQLEKSTCPRCEQPWIEAEMETDLLESRADLKQVLEDIKVSEDCIGAKADWMKDLAALKAKQAEADPKIEQFKKIIHDLDVERFGETCTLQEKFNTTVAEWEKTVQTSRLSWATKVNQLNQINQVTYDAKRKVIDLAQADLTKAIELETKALAALKDVEYRNDTGRREWKAWDQRSTKSAQEVIEASEKVKTTKDALDMEEDFLGLLKSFLTAIFDEVLAEIAWNTNEMLKNVPNVSHVTIGFRSESTTGKGTIRRAIVPYVTIGGVERNPKTALSGGMSTAVELAVDLAVRKVISARTGVKPGWLVLDESMAGLNLSVKEACIQLLQTEAQRSLILVVEHESEFKEMFSKVITIKRENGRSYVEQGVQ